MSKRVIETNGVDGALKKQRSITTPTTRVDLLDSIANSIQKDAKIRAQQPKTILHKPDPNYVDHLTETMLSIPLLENNNSRYDDEETRSNINPDGTPEGGNKTELEIRIGTSYEGSFAPGIQKTDFEAYKRALAADSDLKRERTQETLYFYEIMNGGNIRIHYDEKSKRCLNSELKERLGHPLDLDLFCLPHACRLSISSERPQPIPPTLPDGYKLVRWRNRSSFTSKSGSWNWKVDMTEVKTRVAHDKEWATLYEIEFEFDEDTIKHCRNGDKVQVRAIATRFWDFCVRFLNHLYKSSNDSHFDRSLHLSKVTDVDFVRDLREQCVAWIPGMNTDNIQDFPGSMPVNLSRQHIPIIQKEKYFVSEKTDGIRAMLMILPEQGIYVIDRRFDFYSLPNFNSLLGLYATKGITLLDGEMVTHIRSGKQMYLTFDVLALDGTLYGTKLLSERLEAIGSKVILPYREAVATGKIPPDHPFIFMGKQFLDKSQMHKLYSCLQVDADYHRFYVDEKRHHRSDGFIFTPNDPYHPKTCHNLFKWKYVDELSIDLKLHYNKQTHAIAFTCQGDRSEMDYPIKMRPDDIARLQRFMSTQKDTTLVIECCYDAAAQYWKFKCIRTDKVRANHFRVVKDTVDVIHENFDVKELLKCFPPAYQATPPHTQQHHQRSNNAT